MAKQAVIAAEETAIAAGVPNRERVVGMHFFNPPALMKLVEEGRLGRKSGRGFYEYGDAYHPAPLLRA